MSKASIERATYAVLLAWVLIGLLGGALLFPELPARFGDLGAALLPVYALLWVGLLYAGRWLVIAGARRIVRVFDLQNEPSVSTSASVSVDCSGYLPAAATATASILMWSPVVVGVSYQESDAEIEASATATIFRHDVMTTDQDPEISWLEVSVAGAVLPLLS